MADRQFHDPSTWPALERGLRNGSYKSVRGIGIVAAVLICVAAAMGVVASWSDAENVAWPAPIALLVAGTAFLMWLWQARQNAEILCAARHRRGSQWLTLSWLVPIVNLWFPYQIMADIYRASRPDNPPGLVDLRLVRGSSLLGAWWWLWLVNTATTTLVILGGGLSDDAVRLLVAIGSWSLAGAAVPIIMIMRKISAWQTPRWPT